MAQYRVTVEEEPNGLGTVVAIVLMIVIVVSMVQSCGGDTGGADSLSSNTGYHQSEDSQGTVAQPTAEPSEIPLAALVVYGDHSDVVDNIRDEGTVTDSYGNTYHAPYFDLCSYGAYGSYKAVSAYTDLVAGGKYNYLEGTYFCRNKQSDDFTITFQVYADGKLVYDSGEISRSTKATYFKVPIDHADIVRVISFSNDYSSLGTNPGIILVDAKVTQ